MNGDALEIYRIASTRVPAYRRFLEERLGRIPAVTTPEEFAALPMTSKADYIKKYPLRELCLDGTVRGNHMFIKSSGTSGKAFYWPVANAEDPGPEPMVPFWARIFREEVMPTLVVAAFPLGSWSTGVTTACTFKNLAQVVPGLSVVTPGYDSAEILEILEQLSPLFRQTIILTFPLYAKSILEEGRARGLPLESYNIMLVVGGESITETYRDGTLKLFRSDPKDVNSIWCIYGSADFGDTGFESRACIAVRRILYENGLAMKVLGTDVIPMIFQSPAGAAHREVVENEMVVSRIQGAPIVRYRTGDHVEFIEYDEMVQRITDCGYDLSTYLSCPDLHPPMKAPFLLLHGRVDGAVFFHGAYITIEQVREALERPALSCYYSGRFLVRTVDRSDGESELEVTLEDRPETRRVVPEELTRLVAEALSSTHDQYREFCAKAGSKALPRIALAPADAFRAGWKCRHFVKK